MFTRLKAWYLKTFLPFEDSSHSLHTPPPYDPSTDPDWDDLGHEEGPSDQRPIFNGSMILRSRKWFEENGMEFPEKR